jgi:hypothetical protein
MLYFCFLLVISLFKMVHDPSVEVLSGVHKLKKAVVCFREKKVCVSENLAHA